MDAQDDSIRFAKQLDRDQTTLSAMLDGIAEQGLSDSRRSSRSMTFAAGRQLRAKTSHWAMIRSDASVMNCDNFM